MDTITSYLSSEHALLETVIDHVFQACRDIGNNLRDNNFSTDRVCTASIDNRRP
jgi:hypothetical protein